jgi:predicted nucleic acid-binding protein
MIVVSDTSPIRALAFLEQLTVLERLFLRDEAAGREMAVRQGLVPLGIAGVLLRAKRAGFLRDIRPLLDRLSDDLGFFLADALRRHILDQAGE